MTLLNVERIKLFSTRSPYWCLALIVFFGIGLTLLVTLTAEVQLLSLSDSRRWVELAISVVMVMSALSITTEYRFGTIRNSFLAVPGRTGVLVAKAVVLAGLSFIAVAVTSVVTYLLARTILSSRGSAADLSISTAAQWRGMWGPAVVAALAAVIGIGVGALIRQSAGAIAILILWPTVIENLFLLFGDWGRSAYSWLPFKAASQLYSGDDPIDRALSFASTPPTWWQGLLILAAVAAVAFGAAVLVVKRRDA